MSGFFRFWFVIFSSSVCFQAWSQSSDDCELILNQASEELATGHFLGIDSLLMPCLQNGFTREQRQRAHLLLAQVYLLLDEPEAAEDSYLKLLKANPEFVTDPSRDPIDVVYLSRKFTATPIFSLFGRLGGNVSPINIIHYEYITGGPTATKTFLKPGWTAAIGGDWNINDNLSVSTEVQLAFTSYRIEEYGQHSTSDTDFHDRQGWINFPVSVKYYARWGRWRPYGYAGASINYLFQSRATYVRVDRPAAGSEIQIPAQSPLIDNKYKRNSLARSFIVGGGLQLKWGYHYIFGDLRYAMGMSNLVSYRIGDPAFVYGTGQHFFRMDHLFVTIGYYHQLYKPRKLKKARTGAVLRDVIKSGNE